MATSTITLPENTWTLISNVSVDFQMQGKYPAYIVESIGSPADDLSIRKTALAGVMYTYSQIGSGDFYARPVGDTAVISIEPVA